MVNHQVLGILVYKEEEEGESEVEETNDSDSDYDPDDDEGASLSSGEEDNIKMPSGVAETLVNEKKYMVFESSLCQLVGYIVTGATVSS